MIVACQGLQTNSFRREGWDREWQWVSGSRHCDGENTKVDGCWRIRRQKQLDLEVAIVIAENPSRPPKLHASV